MANLCMFEIRARSAKKENLEAFFNAMRQEGNVWMGRGADIDIIDYTKTDDGKILAMAIGDCKWSVESALSRDALSMAAQKETGDGCWHGITKDDPREFITLNEAAARWEVDYELFSEESGMCFAEHVAFVNGKSLVNETHKFIEYFIYDLLEEYGSLKAAEDALGMEFTETEIDDGIVQRGGMAEAYYNYVY